MNSSPLLSIPTNDFAFILRDLRLLDHRPHTRLQPDCFLPQGIDLAGGYLRLPLFHLA